MKQNEPHHWNITLHGKPNTGKKAMESADFIGTIEGVLREADEMESGVDFDVTQFVITRGEPAQ